MNKGNEHVQNRTRNYDLTDGDNTAKCLHFAYGQSECAHAVFFRASNISAQKTMLNNNVVLCRTALSQLGHVETQLKVWKMVYIMLATF